jgi:hypothetical protein
LTTKPASLTLIAQRNRKNQQTQFLKEKIVNKSPIKKCIFKLFALCMMFGGLVFLLAGNQLKASADDDFGCYGNYQVCLNNCAALPDPYSCSSNCGGGYNECIWMFPVDNTDICLQQCPNCSASFPDPPPEGCWQEYLMCKSACLSGPW